jgi:SOS response regulatory protein OraA/RecX
MLASRDLSETQLRQRLARRGHDGEAIASTIARLMAAGALDDARAAGAIARIEAMIRRRGRLRVRQRLAAAGIAPDLAERVLDDVFDQVDADAMVLAALEKRLAGRAAIADTREFGRLYRYLVGQGFEAGRVLRLLRLRRAAAADGADSPDD